MFLEEEPFTTTFLSGVNRDTCEAVGLTSFGVWSEVLGVTGIGVLVFANLVALAADFARPWYDVCGRVGALG